VYFHALKPTFQGLKQRCKDFVIHEIGVGLGLLVLLGGKVSEFLFLWGADLRRWSIKKNC
jgi:hypothetical protein